MSGAIPPFLNTPSWRGAQLKRRDFTFIVHLPLLLLLLLLLYCVHHVFLPYYAISPICFAFEKFEVFAVIKVQVKRQ